MGATRYKCTGGDPIAATRYLGWNARVEILDFA